jgi:hypothetical protein
MKIFQGRKRKKNKRDSSTIKEVFIRELSTVQQLPEEFRENGNSKTPSERNFFSFYFKITNAERQNGITSQEVIGTYNFFGMALLECFEFHRKYHLEHEAYKKVNEEVCQRLPNTISDDAISKKTEMACKVNAIFRRVGDDKINRIRSWIFFHIAVVK